MKVDHDYVINSAKVALRTGCQHFCLVSATGSDANSRMEIPKIKGQAEDAIKALNFARLTIARPLIITGKETRPWTQKVLDGAVKPINWICPGAIAVSASDIAKALIYDVIESYDRTDHSVQFNSSALAKQAKLFDANIPRSGS